MEHWTQVMLLAAQWERAKGELRALASMQGNRASHADSDPGKWQDLTERVEAFIESVEDNGLHE